MARIRLFGQGGAAMVPVVSFSFAPTNPAPAVFASLSPPPDCRRCGVCCFSDSAEYVWVRGDDWGQLGDAADKLAHFIGHRAFMRMHEGHCAALEVRRDAEGRAEFFCTIYERRPQICRDLARGSAECEADRETKAEHVSRVTA